MTKVLSKAAQDLSWLITGFTERVPGVQHAMVASSDGMPITLSDGVSRTIADQLAAVTSTLFIVLMILGIFAVDLIRRWWKENEWKRRWKARDKEEEL